MTSDEFWDWVRLLALFVLIGAAFTACRVMDRVGTDPHTFRVGPLIFDAPSSTNVTVSR